LGLFVLLSASIKLSFSLNSGGGNVNKTNYLTIQRNQNSPHHCVASWAFSSISAISDKIKIVRQAQWPDAILSPQVLLSCTEKKIGCKGGSPLLAYEWIQSKNITDVTFSPY
jgi:cathepsin X